MTENKVSSQDSWFDLIGIEKKYTFYQAASIGTWKQVDGIDSIYEGAISIDKAVQHYSRSIYTFWDLLGDVGGLLGIL